VIRGLESREKLLLLANPGMLVEPFIDTDGGATRLL
jgi:hypothetical protein